MKCKYIMISLSSLLLSLSSCDKDFEEINVNPVLPSEMDPGYLFSNAQLTSAVGTFYYPSQIVQQLNTPYTGVLEGGNHNIVFDPNTSAAFNSYYTGPIKHLADVIASTRDNPDRSNLYNMARIWKAYIFQILVDTYGDVPYFEAGGAWTEKINLPKYDDQALIYDDIIKEYQEATAALDAAKPTESGDIFYKGDIIKWKRLGNSLLLRAGMRYSKTDPRRAEQLVQIATDAARGGVLVSNDDNAFTAFNSIFTNPTGAWFQGTERGNAFLGAPFVDYLKNTGDPRLAYIAVKYAVPANPLATAGAENTNPQDQQGLPYGYNESTIVNAPGYPGKTGAAFNYSQVNRRTVGKIDAPEFFVTYAQTQLLLAEAALRGWITGDAAGLYTDGVRAHMTQLSEYDNSATIPVATQDAYLVANPFDPSRALEQINTQYWLASFLNGNEAWANFRRSGFPDLAPNPYPAADPAVKGAFIRRLTYPSREQSVNSANYSEAVARIGGDNLGIPVFWDK